MASGPALTEVYDHLDAAEVGLLDAFEPRPGGSGYYKLVCPSCRQRRAYYYAGSGVVQCNRRNSCGARWNVVDLVMEQRGLEFAAAADVVRQAAGFATRAQQGAEQAVARVSPSLRQALEEVLQGFLRESRQAKEFLAQRGYGKEVRRDLPVVGYYPDWQSVDRALRQRVVDPSPLYEWAVLPPEERRSEDGSWLMDGRVVVLWPAPGDWFFLCGRRMGDGPGPKNYYSPGSDLSVPWGYRRTRGVVWAAEGMFDRLALEAAGYPGCAVGMNQVNYDQAAYIASRPPQELGFVTDAGPAGVEGGLKTVERVERLGVPVRVACVPEGRDDIDAVRANDGNQAVGDVLAKAVTGGAYVARTLLTALHREPNKRAQRHAQALKFRDLLTPASRNDFDRLFRGYGWPLDDDGVRGPRLLLGLIEAGLPARSATRVVREHTGEDLSALIENTSVELAHGG